MKELISDKEENFQEEEVMPQCLDVDDRLEKDDASACSLSGNKSSFQETNPSQHLDLDGRKSIDAKKCIKKSCNKKQCDDELTIPSSTSLYSFQKHTTKYVDSLSEFRSSPSLSIICRSPSRFHIPLNLSSKFFSDGIKTRRRTRSTTDLGDFIIEYASADCPKNVIINPYGKWVIDTKDEKMRSIIKQSVLLNLGDLESNLGLSRVMSVNSGETKSALLKGFPGSLDNAASEKSNSGAIPFNKKRSALMTSDEVFESCSSSISTCSSTSHITSKGLLQLLWKGGIPYFVFMIDSEGGEIYVATPRKVSSSNDKTLDYMYSFHSRSYHQKTMGRFGNTMSDIVGKMKVSSSLSFNSNRSRFMETEFVLFSASADHARDVQISPNFLKNVGLPKKMMDIFKLNYHSKHKSGPQKASQLKFEEFFPCLDELDMFDKLDRVDLLEDYLPTNLELAAIVIKDHQQEHNKETVIGGWGLKFLEKTASDHANASTDVSICTSYQESSMVENAGSSRSINVLVPAGVHGGPSKKLGGPSSLTERWKSGGHCDCGGWDIGCPLTVLNNRSTDMGTLSSRQDCQEDQNSLNLFTEGTKQGEASLRMVNVQEGLYFVYFPSSLSALQSFSIGGGGLIQLNSFGGDGKVRRQKERKKKAKRQHSMGAHKPSTVSS
ncbi:hypothetical protein Taro_034850, partial [Colocasia esculenta]|nr:hypothetical protein [Colocasia esculenta]